MSGKTALLFISIVFILGSILNSILGCARPNYQTAPSPTPSTNQKLEASDLRYSLTWNQTPVANQYLSFVVKFYSGNQSETPIDPPYSLFVELWMPSMNHGSAPTQVDKIAPGIYQVSKVFFIMPGEWDIRLQLKEGSTVHDQSIIPILL